MNEINNIVKQFTDLQHSDCWIGVNFKEALQEVNASTAAKKHGDNTNSIWQLVNHLIYWRTSVVNRLNGSTGNPPFLDFRVPEALDEPSWRQTLQDFEFVYHQLRSTIAHFNPAMLHHPSIKPSQTNFELMIGCLQHDAYHLGQVVLLKKQLLAVS